MEINLGSLRSCTWFLTDNMHFKIEGSVGLCHFSAAEHAEQNATIFSDLQLSPPIYSSLDRQSSLAVKDSLYPKLAQQYAPYV